MRTIILTVLAIAAFWGSPRADAGNGSNYIHLLNGLDYFFLGSPPNGALQGIWRCFPSDVLHSPTLVVDPSNPEVGSYASKVCAIHISGSTPPGGVFVFPTISISTSDGDCQFLRSGGTALNFGLVPLPSIAPNVGFVVGPLSGNGVPASNLVTQLVLTGTSITNPASAPSIIVQLTLALAGVPGSPSAIPVPSGDAMTLWLQEDPAQTPSTRMYWAGSLDERNICSGYSFFLSASGAAFGFNSAWEYSTGVGTVDATLTAMITSTGGGPSSLNAHAGTAFTQPVRSRLRRPHRLDHRDDAVPRDVDGGRDARLLHYDERNAFGGFGRLVVLNLWGVEATASATCSDRSPTFTKLPTGGPGGPVLTPLLTAPRSVAQIDSLALHLLSNAVWIAATTHSGVAGGSNIPWFPAGAGISGSTGNTGGFALPLPIDPTLIGTQVFYSSLSLDAAGTSIAKLAAGGHSHSNSGSILFFP